MLSERQAIIRHAVPAIRECKPKPGARLALVGALASLVAVSAPARAQDGVATAPTAESKTQDLATPARDTTDCLDANERSITLENEGKDLAARENLRACAALKCPTEVREECERRLTEINQAIPSILFEFSDGQGNPVKVTQVRRDGELQSAQGSQVLLEADPGPHVFVFEAPGYAAARSELLVTARQQRRLERVTFSATLQAPEEAASSTKQGLPGQRLAALILGGTSVVAAGVGATFGLMAAHRDHDVDKVCDAHFCANPADTQKSKTAVAQGNLSTIFFALAAGAAGGGLLLWFTAPEDHSNEMKLRLGLGLGTLRVRGTF
jgi:hypothetical protein